MIALDYRCPTQGCREKFFEGPAGVVVQARCRKCKTTVIPAAQEGAVLHRVYRCGHCKRKQTVDLPKNERAYCMVCGTETLTIIDEVCIGPAAPGGALETIVARTQDPSIDQRP